jgi:DNA invertase Pin-like site-specific DNA recombinase
VAYYRVSTGRQGAIGLDAQRASVQRFLGPRQALAAAFTEVESGRRDANRPQLCQSALNSFQVR